MTTGTYSFVSFILNVGFVGLLAAATTGSESRSVSVVALLVIAQFLDHVKIRLFHS